MASNEDSEHKSGGLVLLGPYKACNISQTEKQALTCLPFGTFYGFSI
jgi:hypothetical protein